MGEIMRQSGPTAAPSPAALGSTMAGVLEEMASPSPAGR
jgi:hypothetical protein